MIEELSVGEEQRVEILKALYRGVDLLILDEPTAVLTPLEAKDLFENLRRLRDDGKAIVFISHKLDEVLDIADRITVLRRGQVVGETRPAETSKAKLAEMMVGRPVLFRLEKPEVEIGEPVLEVDGLLGEGKLNGICAAGAGQRDPRDRRGRGERAARAGGGVDRTAAARRRLDHARRPRTSPGGRWPRSATPGSPTSPRTGRNRDSCST